ncbi:hypothetical protein SANA_24770 [Gottschalkiaceae bacterium SANA]|nr:hypothetical protein SANA_24770 [Gottschalkiaceae bacterium SANA]
MKKITFGLLGLIIFLNMIINKILFYINRSPFHDLFFLEKTKIELLPYMDSIWQAQAGISFIVFAIITLTINNLDKSYYGMSVKEFWGKHYKGIDPFILIFISLFLFSLNTLFYINDAYNNLILNFSLNILVVLLLAYLSFELILFPTIFKSRIANWYYMNIVINSKMKGLKNEYTRILYGDTMQSIRKRDFENIYDSLAFIIEVISDEENFEFILKPIFISLAQARATEVLYFSLKYIEDHGAIKKINDDQIMSLFQICFSVQTYFRGIEEYEQFDFISLINREDCMNQTLRESILSRYILSFSKNMKLNQQDKQFYFKKLLDECYFKIKINRFTFSETIVEFLINDIYNETDSYNFLGKIIEDLYESEAYVVEENYRKFVDVLFHKICLYFSCAILFKKLPSETNNRMLDFFREERGHERCFSLKHWLCENIESLWGNYEDIMSTKEEDWFRFITPFQNGNGSSITFDKCKKRYFLHLSILCFHQGNVDPNDENFILVFQEYLKEGESFDSMIDFAYTFMEIFWHQETFEKKICSIKECLGKTKTV